ncbi:hypothetical protein [Photobacterium leiognathi]|uniref:hypothetical protein n=1 Tax=Photobacterium leiognathi TaxID=553611 RepID=UPI002981BA25|nr:hypothetical protein [Photobacterium leiognathi]
MYLEDLLNKDVTINMNTCSKQLFLTQERDGQFYIFDCEESLLNKVIEFRSNVGGRLIDFFPKNNVKFSTFFLDNSTDNRRICEDWFFGKVHISKTSNLYQANIE